MSASDRNGLGALDELNVPRVRLTVTRGRHEGALLELPEGEHLLGADADCDVVLGDPGVAPQHCQLELKAQRLNVSTFEGAQLYINGHARSGSNIAVPEGAALLIGEACVIVELIAPALAPTVAVVVAGQHAVAADSVQAGRTTSRLVDWLAAWGVMVAGVAGVGMAATVPSVIAPTPDAGRSLDVPSMKAALSGVGGNELLVRDGKDGRIRLDGFVSDEVAASELRRRVAQLRAGEVEHGYQVVESLQRQILGYLDERNVRLTYQGRGRFVAAGRALSHRFHARAADLANELNGVAELDVSGVEAPPPPGEKRPLPLRIVSVQVSPPAQFTTADGTRYFVGARLSDGAEVVSIQPGRVLFLREGRSIIYRLSREEMSNGTNE